MSIPEENHTSRRQFLKTSTTAILSGAIAAPAIFAPKARAVSPGDTLKVGLIGCGGRGSGAANQALHADKNVKLTALGDAFEDRLENGLKSLQAEHQDKVQVEPDHRFVGLDAYQKVIDSGADVVILGSGFCWRSHYPKRAAFRQVLDGAVGEIASVYSTYNTTPVKDVTIRKPDWTDLQVQLRNWYQFSWLSGDHIVEQAVHSLDMMSWAMGDAPPARITGHGGRQVRTSLGNIYDHFAIVYEY